MLQIIQTIIIQAKVLNIIYYSWISQDLFHAIKITTNIFQYFIKTFLIRRFVNDLKMKIQLKQLCSLVSEAILLFNIFIHRYKYIHIYIYIPVWWVHMINLNTVECSTHTALASLALIIEVIPHELWKKTCNFNAKPIASMLIQTFCMFQKNRTATKLFLKIYEKVAVFISNKNELSIYYSVYYIPNKLCISF